MGFEDNIQDEINRVQLIELAQRMTSMEEAVGHLRTLLLDIIERLERIDAKKTSE